MFDVVFIEMPFADINMPSLGLTRLKYVACDAFPDQVTARILYLSHRFADFLGTELYQAIALDIRHLNTGVGDWLFRSLAFPWLSDNTEDYFARFYPRNDATSRAIRKALVDARSRLDAYLDQIVETHGLASAQLVGFSSMFAQNAASFALARKLKAINPAMTVVMGGANCEHPMGEEIVRNVDVVDYVFSGPALVSFPMFLDAKLHAAERLNQIPGVISKASLVENPIPADERTESTRLGPDLDIDARIPLDYADFLESHGRIQGARGAVSLPFQTSRGCWWGEMAQCTFCGENSGSMKFRVMSPGRAIEEIRGLFRYASRCQTLFATDNIMPRNYVTEVLPSLETPQGVSILYEVKANLSENDVRMLSKAKVKTIQPGIEALSTSTLKLMKKGSTAFQNLALLKNCVSQSITVWWNLLIGFPGEEEAVYEKYCRDIPLLVHLPPPGGVYPVRFDRYSQYFNHASTYGLDLHPCDYYPLIYPFVEASLAKMAYFFVDLRFDAPYVINAAKWYCRLNEAVRSWQDGWRVGRDARPWLSVAVKPGQYTVFDSRFGSPVNYALSADAAKLLDRLAVPATRGRLLSEFDSERGFDIDRELSVLQEHKLLFEENGRFLSLLPKSCDGDMRLT